MSDPGDEPHHVPTVEQMWFNLEPPQDPHELLSACPHCDSKHRISDMIAALGPLARSYSCPNATGTPPLVSIYRETHGWQLKLDPTWASDGAI